MNTVTISTSVSESEDPVPDKPAALDEIEEHCRHYLENYSLPGDAVSSYYERPTSEYRDPSWVVQITVSVNGIRYGFEMGFLPDADTAEHEMMLSREIDDLLLDICEGQSICSETIEPA